MNCNPIPSFCSSVVNQARRWLSCLPPRLQFDLLSDLLSIPPTMATAEKQKQEQPAIPPDEYSDGDYDTDDYSLSEDEQDQAPQRPNQQQSRRRQQQQRRRQEDEYDDESDFFSDEYDSEYDDDDFDNAGQGNAMQPYQRGTQSLTNNIISNGAMTDAPGQGKGDEEQEGLKLKLELNLDIEVELKAHIHGDLTLSLLA